MNPLVFDIQRFSIHDGPGIRTVVFLKGCNLECPWCQNPESVSPKAEIAFYPDKCILSKDCFEVCDENAIIFEGDKRIDYELCTGCGKCTEVCVTNALKLIGKQRDIEDVLQEIKKDIDYYNSSGGGLTISGGEPTLNFDFSLNLLKGAKELGINTNIETNGYFNWNKFKELLPFLDLIYCDIKIIDADKNKEILKGNSPKMIENIKRLSEIDVPVEFRIPLIPTFTSTDENLNDIINLLKTLSIKKVHLLPYHNMGEAKADKINNKLHKLELNYLSQDDLNNIKILFNNAGIKVKLNN